MGDSSLRAKLAATDLTPPEIQASASGMIKMYNNPSLAVSEWRNVLQSCRTSQLLPLLYVANEVLQTSKRNRGNKFLESFSEVLPCIEIHLWTRCVGDGEGAKIIQDESFFCFVYVSLFRVCVIYILYF